MIQNLIAMVKKYLWVIAGVIGVSAVAGSGWWFLWRKPTPPPTPVAVPETDPDEALMAKALAQSMSARSADRLAAIKETAHVKNAGALAKMLDPLARDQDVKVRERAVKRLGDVKHPDAKKSLAGALNDKDMYVAVYAAEALAKQGDGLGKDLAVRMMKDVDDTDIRLSALRTVELSRDMKLRPEVKKMTRVKDPLVQQAARDVLAKWDLLEKEAAEKAKKEKEAIEMEKKEKTAVPKGKEEKPASQAHKQPKEEVGPVKPETQGKTGVAPSKKSLESFKEAMVYYRKLLARPGYEGNHAVYELNKIIGKYRPLGVDVSEANEELKKQEVIRMAKKSPASPVGLTGMASKGASKPGVTEMGKRAPAPQGATVKSSLTVQSATPSSKTVSPASNSPIPKKKTVGMTLAGKVPASVAVKPTSMAKVTEPVSSTAMSSGSTSTLTLKSSETP